MAKTSRSVNLDSVTKRLGLPAGKPHHETLQSGSYLRYERKRSGMGGSWFVRWYDPETRKQRQAKIGISDDLTAADGISVYDYEQAKKICLQYCKSAARLQDMKSTGVEIFEGDYLVHHSVADYIASLRQDGKASAKDFELMSGKWIVPLLGAIKVKKLTGARLNQWRSQIAAMPKRGKKTVGDDPDSIRRRKDSANHMLVILKTALSNSVKSGKSDPPVRGGWHEATYFEGVSVSRTRFLNPDEKRLLVEACDSDFRKLVIGALYSGARYMELANMLKKHFDQTTGRIYFGPYGKVKGKTRFVSLTEEAADWFIEQVEGMGPEDRVFTRKSQRRLRGRGTGRDDIWVDSDQGYYMKKAVEKAGIASLVLHELRHTYASDLLNAGVPIALVAYQLGNSVQVCQKVYGHICKEQVGDVIRKLVPTQNLGQKVSVLMGSE